MEDARRPSGPAAQAVPAEESLEELAELAASAGAEIAERVLQTRPAPEAATLIGRGKVEEIAAAVRSSGADVVIFDHDLTPTQQRNLEKAIDAKVIDRTQLILDIFASRARTREGRLQVELAQLNYLLPRLSGPRRRDVAAGRRHRHARSRRNPAGNRPPPHRPPHQED